VGNGDREVVGGAGGDFALSAVAESLRSPVSPEVVTSDAVVLRAVRRLQLRLQLKTPAVGGFRFCKNCWRACVSQADSRVLRTLRRSAESYGANCGLREY